MEVQRGKDWSMAMLACWFLGALGVHRFYTGKKSTAWAMLILSLLGFTSIISWIWALVDGITIALGKFKHADGSELNERIAWVGIVYIVLIILGILAFFILFAAIAAAINSALSGLMGAGAGGF